MREGWNFQIVEKFLKSQRACVRVWTADSQEDFERGVVHGQWALGDASGNVLGSILWLLSGHVLRLMGESVAACEKEIEVGRAEAAPWLHSVCGAPKKGSKRGANLKGRGNEVVMKSVASRRGLGADQAGVVAEREGCAAEAENADSGTVSV